jgi:predicted flap endonuclease-1-like 5' DNA nuclease
MANYAIEDIEGIGPVRAEKFRGAGIKDTDSLLAGCQTRQQRDALAEATGMPAAQLLKFANMADLYRVPGIGSEFAELLEVAGVDTVPELAQRNPANLAEALLAANTAKNLTRRVPSETEVAKWVQQAKSLPRALEY